MNRLCDLSWFFSTPFSVHHGSSALVSAGHSPGGDSVRVDLQKAGSGCPPPSFVCFISLMTPYCYVRASLFPFLLSLTATRLADSRDAQAPSSDSGVCNKPCQRLLLITRLITSDNPTARQGCQYFMSEHQRKEPPPPPAIS